MHSKNITVSFVFMAGSIIALYFSENNIGRASPSNESTKDRTTQYFLSKLDDLNSYDMWFQQDDAKYHTALSTLDFL